MTRQFSLALAGATLTLALFGCSRATQTAATTAPVTTADSAVSSTSSAPRVTTGTPEDCPMAMPGDILTAEDAVVRFSPGMVCPGYVTVNPGTPVGFLNLSDKPETVKLAPEANGTPVWTATLDPGASTEFPTDDLGVLYYQVSAISSFVGTIEVKN